MTGDFEKIEEGPKPTKSDEIIDALTAENTDLKRKILEERFVAIIVAVILFDAIIFRGFTNWGNPLVIGAMELVGLVILARRCNVEDLLALVDRLIGWTGSTYKGHSPPRNEPM